MKNFFHFFNLDCLGFRIIDTPDNISNSDGFHIDDEDVFDFGDSSNVDNLDIA